MDRCSPLAAFGVAIIMLTSLPTLRIAAGA
jgi:hypothetical protein